MIARHRGPLLLSVLIAASPVWACNVPVFRYALERWPADPYRATVLHRGPLTEQDQAAINVLRQKAQDESLLANLKTSTVDLSGKVSEETRKAYDKFAEEGLPRSVVQYPLFSGLREPWWNAELSVPSARALITSPARKEIARRILKGDTAVWVMVESGNKEEDDAKEKLLFDKLKEMPRILQLPEELDFGDGAFAPAGTQESIPLRISFSILRISREDEKEAVLLRMLLNTEGDLHEYAEHPIVFPVFGRGRALYALVGKGINEENILEACGFIAGACSCQVKQQNPGTDLLMSVNWDGFIIGEYVVDKVLPPLSGPGDLIAEPEAKGEEPQTPEAQPLPEESPPEPMEAPGPTTDATDGSGLTRAVVLVLIGLLVVVAGSSVILVWRRPRGY